MVYALVIVCLWTKFTEEMLDSRSTSSFLAALNVVFSLYGSPTKLLAEKEGAMIKLLNNIDKINKNQNLLVEHQLKIELIPAGMHQFQGTVEAKIKQIGLMLGTLDLQATNFSETELSNTFRIISSFINKQPCIIRFVSNTDKSTSTCLYEETSEIHFLAPISFLNPLLEGKFQPILVDTINGAQKTLLQKLNLTENIQLKSSQKYFSL